MPAGRGEPLEDRPAADHGLEAAAASAPASGPIGPDRGVADLPGTEAITLEEAAVDDDAGAHALADLDHEKVRRPRAAEYVLGEGGRLGVGDHVDRQAGALPDEVAEGHVAPVEVDRLEDGPERRVDEAGRP